MLAHPLSQYLHKRTTQHRNHSQTLTGRNAIVKSLHESHLQCVPQHPGQPVGAVGELSHDQVLVAAWEQIF